MESADFIEIVDELARRLEGPAKHVFELAVRQVYVDLLVTLSIFVPLFIVVVLLARKAHNVQWDIFEMSFPQFMGLMFGGVALAISFGFTISAVAGALNPEWRAIHMIARSVLG